MARFSRDLIEATTIGRGNGQGPDGGAARFTDSAEHSRQVVKEVCAELRREARRYSLIEYRWLAVAAAGLILMLGGVFLR